MIHTVGNLGIAAGGPSRTVPALCEHVSHADDRIDVQLLTTEGYRFGPNLSVNHVMVHAIHQGANFKKQRRFLREHVSGDASIGQDDHVILHDHGQWLRLNRASASVARQHGLKRVVSPRGMLTPWSLSHHRFRKEIAWWLFARRDLREASLIHATSQLEANELRDLGARQPIAVIPNGVEFRKTYGDLASKTKTVVFMSRIHAKKGLQELVDVWRKLRPDGWRLIVAGPDESSLIDSLNLSPGESISYAGEVEGASKWQLLEQASLFVLPSYSENFGVVVAEALMAATPVITTHGTPWKSLVDRGCGWWIPTTTASLETSLDDALSRELSELASMGTRGRAHAIESFAWPAVGKQMAEVYQWLIGRGDLPNCVQFA